MEKRLSVGIAKLIAVGFDRKLPLRERLGWVAVMEIRR
jgi:hypothetical protein